MRRSHGFLVLVVVGLTLIGPLAFASDQPVVDPELSSEGNQDGTEVREELVSFFAQSSGFVGDLEATPEVLSAIEDRIEGLGDEKLGQIQRVIGSVPEWQSAPDRLLETIPSEMRGELAKIGTHYASMGDEVIALRNDLATLIAVVKTLPPAELEKRGLDRDRLDTLESAFTDMNPLESAILAEHLNADASWIEMRRSVVDDIPPELRRAVQALSEHGELTADDVEELDQFREDLLDLLDRIERLPVATREKLRFGEIGDLVAEVESASPETAFMIRSELTENQISAIRRSLDLLERVEELTDEDVAELESFRQEMLDTIADAPYPWSEHLAELAPEQLLAMRDELSADPQWRGVFPWIMVTLADPAVAERLRSDGSIDASAMESYRVEAIRFIESAVGQPGVGREQADRSIAVLEAAGPAELFLIQSAAARLPGDSPVSAFVALPPLIRPAVNIDCKFTVLEVEVNLNWICTPLENAINAVDSALQTVKNTVNALPNTIANLFLGLLENIKIGNVSLLSLINSGDPLAVVSALKGALGLNGNAWYQPWIGASKGLATQSIGIPCPPIGTQTIFGEVGTPEAATNYLQYKSILDVLLDIVPDTEVSLGWKIASHVAFMPFNYFQICLDSAASTTAFEEHRTNWTNIINDVDDVSTQVSGVSTQVTGVSVQISALSNQLSNVGTSLGNQIGASTDLALRIEIERTLQDGEGNELAIYQLPSPWGYLELVRDIVRESIDAMNAVGERVYQAEKYYSGGERLMLDGRYKDAFREFQKAYREVIR